MSTTSSVATFHPFAKLDTTNDSAAERTRLNKAFAAYEQGVFKKAHQLFWWLLIGQWVFALAVAWIWSPRAWAGEESTVHPHLLAAIFLGALLVVPPLVLIRLLPFHPVTRHAIAVAQVTFSALLIHLCGGRIETHFHVFGSLAFLALYRDWRLLITATIAVALDHFARGLWYPESVYGVPYASAWRTVEHAGWVVFEVAVLLWACGVSRREMWEICRRDDQNRQLLDQLEQRVQERTLALERSASDLRSSQERYRALVENAPIGIFKSARTGEVLFANPYMLRMANIPTDVPLASINMAESQLFPREERARLWSRLEAENEVRGFETHFIRADGSRIEIVLNARASREGPDSRLVAEGTVEDVTAEKRARRDLEKVNQELVVASRQAGMADVATGVLHNVGNVLTSVNITIQDLVERLKKSRLTLLQRIVETLERERHRLPEFFTQDPAGQRFPDFLAKLNAHLVEENTLSRNDAESLVRHFAHIREVIVTQQSAARLFGVSEVIAPEQLIEDALKLTADSLERHGVTLERQFIFAPAVKADRHKVLQILVNLLKNAKDAVLAAGATPPRIIVRVAASSPTEVAFSIIDNGLGIPAENLTRIFSHGFTTKKDGHGFGLHSCVLAARDMKGDLIAESAGAGKGATFTLLLPAATT